MTWAKLGLFTVCFGTVTVGSGLLRDERGFPDEGVINVVFFSFLFMYAVKTWKKFDRWSSFLISSFVVLCEDEL